VPDREAGDFENPRSWRCRPRPPIARVPGGARAAPACWAISARWRRGQPTPSCAGFWACFLFGEDDVFKSIGVVSDGERNRYALVRMLMELSNFLLLDEPTNPSCDCPKSVLVSRDTAG
jgi:ABC transporter family protein